MNRDEDSDIIGAVTCGRWLFWVFFRNPDDNEDTLKIGQE